MKLHGTYASHFTRKVRILLEELKIRYEFSIFTDLLAVGAANFAQNPLQMFPVLEDGDRWIIESDIICEYIIEKYGENTPFHPLYGNEIDKFDNFNRLSIINGGMEAGVHRIRATRSGLQNLDDYAFFQQEKAAITQSLEWLNADLAGKTSYNSKAFTYLDLCLICFCEWIVFRDFVPDLQAYPNLDRFVKHHQDRPSIAKTHPAIGAR